MIEMHHFVTIDSNGWYHVQNVVGSLQGQHHVHTKKGFEKWKKGTREERIHPLEGHYLEAPGCDCGLKPGDVRDHNGHVTHNPRWGDDEADH